MNAIDTVELAFQSLRGNMLRSILTALGVIIGIAAVIVMVSVGQGTQAELDRVISQLGSNRIELLSGAARTGAASLGVGSRPALTESDATAIKRDIPEAEYVAASVRQSGQVVYGDQNWFTSTSGVSADYFPINNWVIESGEGFSARDYTGSSKVALIGQTVKKNLFGDEDPLGKTIRITKVPFRVTGVLKSKGQGGFGQDLDDTVFVPLSTAKRRIVGGNKLQGDWVQQISIGVDRSENLSVVQDTLGTLMRERHKIVPGAQDDFQIRNLAEIISARSQTTRMMSILLGAVAGISLLVGGIGIMNIMLVSVTERIKEIGLRMATGAGPREIQWQFLAEALAISLIGGAIGIALGIAGTFITASVSALPAQLNLSVILLATGFALATGLFFGYYPARKAARLDPIEALRYE